MNNVIEIIFAILFVLPLAAMVAMPGVGILGKVCWVLATILLAVVAAFPVGGLFVHSDPTPIYISMLVVEWTMLLWFMKRRRSNAS